MMIYFLFCNFCLLFISYWSTASEQWFASFRWMAKGLHHAYIRVHSPLNSPSMQAKHSSRCYTVGPCWLSITSSSNFSRKSLNSPIWVGRSCHTLRQNPVLYCAHHCMKCSLSISNFLEEFSAAAAAKSPQSCPTLCCPMDHSLPGSSVHRIL